VPRHQAGSEIYALELCRALSAEHHVSVLSAEYDPSRRHGHVTWRVQDGLPVIEIVNNWVCSSFEDTYRSPLIGNRIGHVLHAVQPDIVHIHNLLNLSFDLPAMARARGIPIVATLHDYALVCPSGGPRIHRSDQHLCGEIDGERCVRCFRESPFHAQMSFGRLAATTHAVQLMHRAAVALLHQMPRVTEQVVRAVRLAPAIPLTKDDIERRLAAAQGVFEQVDLFVAPSPSIAGEFERLGISGDKIRVADYGFVPFVPPSRNGNGHGGKLRFGYVGTLVWHKGVHVLLEAVCGLPAGSYELKIFGNPDVFPDYTAELRERASGLPVQFMGAFDRDCVADAYKQLDVLVVPSLWLENSPLVIHEAFMAGLPVVGARIGGIADLVAHGRTGLLYEPHSRTELHDALRGLIEHPQELSALAASVKAETHVRSIGDDARAWNDTYADLLRRQRGAVQTT
jgi:glycosyltransferase involved in cell wall biosynthesis